MESQPQNPEFRICPENFHPWQYENLNEDHIRPKPVLNSHSKIYRTNILMTNGSLM